MDINPWQVKSIQEFSFLKCPECAFDSKEEDTFQDHAIENHPLKSEVRIGSLFGQIQRTEFFFIEVKAITKIAGKWYC